MQVVFYFHNQPPEPNDTFAFAITPDGVQNGYLFFWSSLTNGRGKHPDPSKYPYIKSRLSIFTVNPGEVAIPLPFVWSRQFSLPVLSEHQLRVIATDGYLVHVSTDYIMIKSGERYDFFCKQKTVLNFSILEKQTFGSEVKCYQ